MEPCGVVAKLPSFSSLIRVCKRVREKRGGKERDEFCLQEGERS
jgi:hypothetical protein